MDQLSWYLSLPDDVLVHNVLSQTPLDVLLNLCSSDKRLGGLCQLDELWYYKIMYDFPEWEWLKPPEMSYYDFYLVLTKYKPPPSITEGAEFGPWTPRGGLTSPALFNHEICNSFANAELGSLIAIDANGISQPSQLPLNVALFFTDSQINSQHNPLYGVMKPNTLSVLFHIHVYYAWNPTENKQGLQYSLNRNRLTASYLLKLCFNKYYH